MGILDFFRSREGMGIKRRLPFKDFELLERKKGDYNKFKKKLIDSSLIILIIGKRGSGKTSLGMKLLEFFNRRGKRKCYVMGYSKTMLPRWIKKVERVEDAPNNSVVLVDEGAIGYFSRDSMRKANKMLSKIMIVARHKGLSLLLVTQNSGLIELNVVRLADTLIFKEPSLLQTRFERGALKDMFKKITPLFKERGEEAVKSFYVWDDDFEGMLAYDLPPFWSEAISKSFKDFGK
jgi:GTPase SAR1 family protein